MEKKEKSNVFEFLLVRDIERREKKRKDLNLKKDSS